MVYLVQKIIDIKLFRKRDILEDFRGNERIFFLLGEEKLKYKNVYKYNIRLVLVFLQLIFSVRRQ